MLKSFLLATIGVLVLVGCTSPTNDGVTAQPDSAPRGDTVHDNKVLIEGPGVTFTPKEGSWHNKDGREWQGIAREADGQNKPAGNYEPLATAKGLTIIANAERKGDADTAQWWKEQIKGGYTLNKNNVGKQPKKLNFAFCGDLIAAGSKAFVCFGQGHHSGMGENDWWVSGPGFKFNKKAHISGSGTVEGRGGICLPAEGLCITTIENNYDQFRVFADGCPGMNKLGCLFPGSQWQVADLVGSKCTQGRECVLAGFDSQISRTVPGFSGAPNFNAGLPQVFEGKKICSVSTKSLEHGEVVGKGVGSGDGNGAWLLLKSGKRNTDTRIQTRVTATFAVGGSCGLLSETSTATYAVNWDPRSRPKIPDQDCWAATESREKNGTSADTRCALSMTSIDNLDLGPEESKWNRIREKIIEIGITILAEALKVEMGGSPVDGLAPAIQDLVDAWNRGDAMLSTQSSILAVHVT